MIEQDIGTFHEKMVICRSSLFQMALGKVYLMLEEKQKHEH